MRSRSSPRRGGAPRTLDLPRSQYSDVAWSPDGQDLAVIVNNRYLDTLKVDGSGLHLLTSVPASDLVATPAWSPDGRSIAYTWIEDSEGGAGAARDGSGIPPTSQVHLMIEPTSGGEPHELVHGWAPAWSSDGTQIAYGSPEGWIALVDVAMGRTGKPVAGGTDPAWTTDGKLLSDAFGDGFSTIYETDVGSNEPGNRSHELIREGAVPRVSPDGKLAYLNGDLFGVPTESDASGRDAHALSDRPASWLSWSPDGTRLAVTFVNLKKQPKVPAMSGVPTIDVRPP